MIEPPLQHRVHPGRLSPTRAQSGVVIAGAAIAATSCIIGAGGGGDDPLAISRAMGGMVASCIVAGIVAGSVYAATRKRSLWPTAIIAAAVMILTSMGSVAGHFMIFRGAATARVWRDLDRANVRTLDELRSIADSPNAPAEFKSIMGRHEAEIERIGADLTGNDAAMVKVGVGFSRDITTIMGQYLVSLQPFKNAGGLAADSLKNKDAVTKRRTLLKLPLTMHTTILSSFRLIPEDLRNRFRKSGATGDTRAYEQGMLKGMHFEQLLRIHVLENQMLVLMDEHLADLEAHPSKWASKNGAFVFSDQKALDAFNQRTQKLQGFVQEQDNLRAQLLGGSQRP